MNSKKTKGALFSSVIALMLCFAMLLGTTFAWFTDSEVNSGNIIKSGTLDVEMSYAPADGTTWKDASEGPIFENTHWEPGYTEVRYIKVENKGNLAFQYQLNIVPTAPAAAGEINLADVIDVYMVMNPADTSVITRDSLATMPSVGTLASLMGDADGAARGILIPDAADRSANFVMPAEYQEGSFTVGIALKMRESAGNEYQNKSVGGEFAVQLLATQYTAEKDSFDHQYDESSEWPVSASGTGTLSGGVYYFHVTDTKTNAKIGSVTIPVAAVEDPTQPVTFTVLEDSSAPNFTISDGTKSQTVNLQASNLKDGNTEKIKYEHYIGEGLKNVTVYHYDTEMAEGDRAYNETSGYVNIQSATFSPFTIVYDVPVVTIVPAPGDSGDSDESDKPTATVTALPEHVGTSIPWGSYGQWSPSDPTQQLAAAYLFAADHTSEEAKASPYAQWYCDFYVKMDRDVDAGAIFLGGNYGSFGWVGFENQGYPVPADYEVPLLGSVTSNPWTYEQVVDFVGEFICGVAQANGSTQDLTGATFTVMLRLTNPEDASDFFNVETIEYTFQ